MNNASKPRISTICLLITVFILTLTLHFTRKDMHRDLQTIARLDQQMAELRDAFIIVTHTEWTITNWETGTDGVNVATIVNDSDVGSKRGTATVNVPLSYHLTKDRKGTMVGKKVIFGAVSKYHYPQVPEEHLTLGGLLSVAIER